MVYSFLQHTATAIQAQCLLCGLSCRPNHAITEQDRPFGLCPSCHRSLPLLKGIDCCHICSIPLTSHHSNTGPTLCGRCIKQRPAYDGSISAMAYEGQTVQLIQQLKRHFDNATIRLLSDLLSQQIHSHNDWPALQQHIDYLIPAPMFWRRNLKRGNNHSSLITSSLSQHLAIPVQNNLIIRCCYSPPQRGLNARERQRNIQGVFNVREAISGLNLAIVDDVMTTGSTMNEMAHCLKAAGAKSVYAFAVARTPFHIQ